MEVDFRPWRTSANGYERFFRNRQQIPYYLPYYHFAAVHERLRTTLIGSSGCHLVFHPFDDFLLAPDDRARTQLDLLREGSVLHTGIDEGLAHPRDLKDLWEAQETGLGSTT